jgi:hypothetical protein
MILRILLILIVVALTTFAIYSRGSVGDLRGASARLAVAHSRERFDPTLWSTGDATRRGGMLADLMKGQKFYGMHRDSVVRVLGRSDCYSVQDGWACYEVQLGARSYQLAFALNEPERPRQVSAVYLKRKP